MKRHSLIRLSTAFVLSLSSLLMINMAPVFAAGPYTCTWTGGGTDDKFSTAANWSGCNSAAPVATDGDNLVFPTDSLTTSNNIASNDLTNATFTSVTITGTTGLSMTLKGNSFTLTGGLTDSNTSGVDFIENDVTISGNQTVSLTNSVAVEVDGVVSGTGNLTQSGDGSLLLAGDNSTYTGLITVNGGQLDAGSTNAIGTSSAPGAVINDGAGFVLATSLLNALSNCQIFDFNGNLQLTGNSQVSVVDVSQVYPKLGNGEACGSALGGAASNSYGDPIQAGNVNLAGSITLGSDITFAGIPTTTTITGALSGAFTISMLPGYQGQLIVNSSSNTSNLPNGTYTSAQNV